VAFLERVTAPEPSGDVLFIPPPPAPAAPVRLPDPEVPPSLFSSPSGAEPSVPMEAPMEMAPVVAVTPVGDAHVEETGGRRSRLFLFIAIAVLLVAAVVTFFVVRGRGGSAPAPPAVQPPASQPAAATPAPPPPSQSGTSGPGTSAAAPAAEPVDVQAILKEELAKKERELRRKYDAQFERELAKAQKEAEKRSEGQKPPAQEPPRD
jgi:hypothetical protein